MESSENAKDLTPRWKAGNKTETKKGKLLRESDGDNVGEKEVEKKKMEDITVSWWNGGGKIIPRLKVNPVLKKFLETKPDIFAYGEALIFRNTKEINLKGYKVLYTKRKKRG